MSDAPLTLVVIPGRCGCGCDAPVKSKYKPGHDTRLKSALSRAARDRVRVVVNGEHLDPLVYAERLGWLAVVEKGAKPRPVIKARPRSGRDVNEFLPPPTPKHRLAHPSGWCMGDSDQHGLCPRYFSHGICMCACHGTGEEVGL